MKKNEQCLREMWDKFKCIKKCITGGQKDEKEIKKQKDFWKKMAENFSYIIKNINLHSKLGNINRCTQRHIIVKMHKTKDKSWEP